jgi:hypothetical protein
VRRDACIITTELAKIGQKTQGFLLREELISPQKAWQQTGMLAAAKVPAGFFGSNPIRTNSLAFWGPSDPSFTILYVIADNKCLLAHS